MFIENANTNETDIFIHIDYGMCRLTVYNEYPSVLFLSSLVVDSIHRFNGIGNRILNKVEEIAQSDKYFFPPISVISLQVKTGSWMEKWYERKGFRQTAPGYDEGMVIMSKFIDHDEVINKN